MTLIEATKAKLKECPQAGPACAAPLALLLKASNFEKAAIAAMSIKQQKQDLRKARELLSKGMADIAKLYLLAWKVENRNYKLLFTLGK